MLFHKYTNTLFHKYTNTLLHKLKLTLDPTELGVLAEEENKDLKHLLQRNLNISERNLIGAGVCAKVNAFGKQCFSFCRCTYRRKGAKPVLACFVFRHTHNHNYLQI